MASKKPSQAGVHQLEEEVKQLSEELVQCQADKEFVWSLWKRLQVANPDVSQAISLVLEREKQKAEHKDRKVLEILQVKDNKIFELEQRVGGQQQEVSNVVQRKQATDEQNAALQQQLSGLQAQHAEQCAELQKLQAVHEQSERLTERLLQGHDGERQELQQRCTQLAVEVETLRGHAEQSRQQQEAAEQNVNRLEQELRELRQQAEERTNRCNELRAQVTLHQAQLSRSNAELAKTREQLQELQIDQGLQAEHAAQQSQLVEQLQELTRDTQRVLRQQEETHRAESASLQQMHDELHLRYEALKASVAQLRHGPCTPSSQPQQRDQMQDGGSSNSSSRQTNITGTQQQGESSGTRELDMLLADKEALQERLHDVTTRLAQLSNPATAPVPGRYRSPCRQSIASTSAQGRDAAPRARSLSPTRSSRLSDSQAQLFLLQDRVRGLENLLQVQAQESEELRRAHDRRCERLDALQDKLRVAAEQLQQTEEQHGRGGRKGRPQRAAPHELRQEDSDGVWNELAFVQRENHELQADKLRLQEELDRLRVQAAADRATLAQLSHCLHHERDELLWRLEHRGVGSSSLQPEQMRDSQQMQIVALQRQLKAVEREAGRLAEARDALAGERSLLKAAVAKLRRTAEDRTRQTAAADHESSQLKEKLAQLRETLEQTSCKNSDLGRRMAGLKGQLKRLEEENAGLRGRARDGERALDANADLRRQVARLRREGAESSERCGQLEHRLDGLEAQRLALAEGHGALRQRCRQLRRENAALVEKRRSTARHGGGAPCSDAFGRDAEGNAEEGCEERRAEGSVGPARKRRPGRRRSGNLRHHQAVLNRSIREMGNTFRNFSKDGWEDMSDYSDTDSGTTERMTPSSSLGSLIAQASQARRHTARPRSANCGPARPCYPRWRWHPRGQHAAAAAAAAAAPPHRAPPPAVSGALRRRVASLLRRVAVLRSARLQAQGGAARLREHATLLGARLAEAQQRTEMQRLTAQRLRAEVSELQQKIRVLERSGDEVRGGLPSPALPVPPPASAVVPPAPPAPTPNQDAEIKQLQLKLRGSAGEMSRQLATIKELRMELQEKDKRISELQDKVTRGERDVAMKRQLLDEQRERVKSAQLSEAAQRGALAELEGKVKSLTEEASGRKVALDSMKQRLNVATKAKGEYEQLYQRAKEELDKKTQKLREHNERLRAAEGAAEELEAAASQQLHELASHSQQALRDLHQQLSASQSRTAQFADFVKALAGEFVRHTRETHALLRRAHPSDTVARTDSASRAQSLAASILNITEAELSDILEVDEAQANATLQRDKQWCSEVEALLDTQGPFADRLLQLVLEKMEEQLQLTHTILQQKAT
uniref:Centlein isoform X2 n=1 Tax=Petromyzon marinus TaxID=7757 RepID=A0AAJ7TXL6_PETMA|nr:centlein isoform X2 [Petromyzon marinus]